VRRQRVPTDDDKPLKPDGSEIKPIESEVDQDPIDRWYEEVDPGIRKLARLAEAVAELRVVGDQVAFRDWINKVIPGELESIRTVLLDAKARLVKAEQRKVRKRRKTSKRV